MVGRLGMEAGGWEQCFTFFFLLCSGGEKRCSSSLLNYVTTGAGTQSFNETLETPVWGRVFCSCYFSGFDHSEKLVSCTKVEEIFPKSIV